MARLTQYPQLLSRHPSYSSLAYPGQCVADKQNLLGPFLSPITQTSSSEARNSQASGLRAEEALCILPIWMYTLLPVPLLTHEHRAHNSMRPNIQLPHDCSIVSYRHRSCRGFSKTLSAGTQGTQRLRLHAFAMRVAVGDSVSTRHGRHTIHWQTRS